MKIICVCPSCFEDKFMNYDLCENVDNYEKHYICEKCGTISAPEEMLKLEVEE